MNDNFSSIVESDGNVIMDSGSEEEEQNQNLTSICPVLDYSLIRIFYFWIQGIVLCCVAFVGLILNFIAVYILSTRKSMQNTFNNLLTSLFCFDSIYLLITIVSSIRAHFVTPTGPLTILVAYVIFPMSSVSLTASILMTIGVALERYAAIRNPIIHRQTMRSSSKRRNRLLKYILIVILCSFVFNVPKFLEVEIAWKNSTTTSRNETDDR